MYSKIIINTLLIIALFVLQFAFVSGLPVWFGSANLIIIVLIFIIGMGKINIALWWLFGLGFLMEIFSFAPFGIIFISLALVFALAYALLMNYFTDRTLYSFLAITLLSTTAYDLSLYLLNGLVGIIMRMETGIAINTLFWLNRLQGLITNLVLVFITYYLINYLSRNLKPVFLIRKK